MSTGQKACAMDDEEQHERERMANFQSLGDGTVLYRIAQLKERWQYFDKSKLVLTRGQHIDIDVIDKLIGLLP